ncbi:hypothetical protein E2320_010907, partial [Naja naja]
MRLLISITQGIAGIAAALQQGKQVAPGASDSSLEHSQHLRPQSRDWLSGDEDQRELILLEDEGL